MRNVWESVVSEAWRGSPFILAGYTMQPDRFLNRILIGYIFFWRVNARTLYHSIKIILREKFSIVSKFNFPQEGKRSGLPLPSYIIFFSTYGNILLKKSQDYTEKNTNLGTV